MTRFVLPTMPVGRLIASAAAAGLALGGLGGLSGCSDSGGGPGAGAATTAAAEDADGTRGTASASAGGLGSPSGGQADATAGLSGEGAPGAGGAGGSGGGRGPAEASLAPGVGPGGGPDALQTGIVLSADFSAGDPNPPPERIKEYPFVYSGELTTEVLAAGLTDLTGLAFAVTASTFEDGSLVVDWASDSTLIAGLGAGQPKAGFEFSDAAGMRWFMLDSLWRTAMAQLGVDQVYYTMDGGQELSVPGLEPVGVFPGHTPYLGSPEYFANAA
ncbi:MAG: hypothetical protein LBT54_05485 [Bifidobacteriaceae bacterium]|jgi:hypothetical protein|nr:hypothetical protein [Bifidobacteriaceae bacterium]